MVTSFTFKGRSLRPKSICLHFPMRQQILSFKEALFQKGFLNQEIVCVMQIYMNHMTKPTKWHERPAKTQINLGIRRLRSKSSLCAQWVAKDPSFLHGDSEGSDQTGRMPRLIWVFAGRTFHFVGFVMRWIISAFIFEWSPPEVYHIRTGIPKQTLDPDQTPQNAASNQGLHCLPLIQQF